MVEYREKIEKSKIKQKLIEFGIAQVISKTNNFETIECCYKVLRDEEKNQKFWEKMLENELKARNVKRAEAKKVLGIGG